jgi:hypothetical protein
MSDIGEDLFSKGIIGGDSGGSSGGQKIPASSDAFLGGSIVGGDAYKDLVGIGSQGIDIGTGSLDEIFPRSENHEGVFSSDALESLFGGILSPFGLVKKECYAIKSLGTFLTLQGMSVSGQLKLDLRQNMSISSKGMQQG